MEQYANRKYFFMGMFILVALIYISRLFYLQVIDKSYRLSADNNSRRYVAIYPARGLMYDRNHNLLVYNQAAYDLMISPYQLKAFDTTELCQLLEITKQELKDGIRRSYNPKYRREPFIKQITPEAYAVLQEKLYKYPGFYFSPRTLRKYSHLSAAHIFGYVGEVDEALIADNPFYAMGDYIGISGVEKSYEEVLRGEKGVKIYNVDVNGKIKGSYDDGKYDEDAVVGKDLTLTIDEDLQEFGEFLMQRFIGSIVAIEPATGEILVLVSSPNYDPSLLVGRSRTLNYTALQTDSLKPLFNRALMAKYPPGSTFKTTNALIALQEGRITENSRFGCSFGYHLGSITVGCHGHQSPLDLRGGIQNSCNSYFCNVYKLILEDAKFPTIDDAFTNWRNHLLTFGFGKKLGTDFDNELNGYLPTAELYNKIYGKGRWRFVTVRSLSIGQGEIGITPIQMANMATIIANRGYYYIPHIVKEIDGKPTIDNRFKEKKLTDIKPEYYDIVRDGMELAVNGTNGGTAHIAQLPNIIVCGKTGTAENPHGEDHSIFIAFAPKDTPQIAIAVYVENGGFGSTYAAPIASLLIEKYLTDSISRPYLIEHLINANIDYSKPRE
jgi:penicillin-binding protein 2